MSAMDIGEFEGITPGRLVLMKNVALIHRKHAQRMRGDKQSQYPEGSC